MFENVLRRFFELRAGVKRFMKDGRMDVPEFNDPKWLMDLSNGHGAEHP